MTHSKMCREYLLSFILPYKYIGTLILAMVNRLRFFRGSFCQRFSDPMFAKRYDTVSVCMYVCKTSVLLKIRPFPFPSNERERQNFETAQRKLNLELTLTYHNQKSCLSKTLQYIAKYRYWLNIILDSGRC